MDDKLANDPKVTYAIIKLEDELNSQRENPDFDFTYITSHKNVTLQNYQPVFSSAHLPYLTKVEFESFLLYRNNHHWDSLHRVGSNITADLDLLKNALAILLDENLPIADRLNELRPERYWGEHSKVAYLGTPVLTAILQVVYPDQYGVWNNTSDAGLKLIRLWNRKWETQSSGESYVEMNELFKFLTISLNIDLWTLDTLWWVLKKK